MQLLLFWSYCHQTIGSRYRYIQDAQQDSKKKRKAFILLYFPAVISSFFFVRVVHLFNEKQFQTCFFFFTEGEQQSPVTHT